MSTLRSSIVHVGQPDFTDWPSSIFDTLIFTRSGGRKAPDEAVSMEAAWRQVSGEQVKCMGWQRHGGGVMFTFNDESTSELK